MMAEKSEEKTRVGQSKGFQKLSSKRNVYLEHLKGLLKLQIQPPYTRIITATFLGRSTDSVEVFQIQHSSKFTSRLISPLALRPARYSLWAARWLSGISVPLPKEEKKEIRAFHVGKVHAMTNRSQRKIPESRDLCQGELSFTGCFFPWGTSQF